ACGELHRRTQTVVGWAADVHVVGTTEARGACTGRALQEGGGDAVVFEVERAVEWEDLPEAEGSESPTFVGNTGRSGRETAELAERSLRFLKERTSTTPTSMICSAGVSVVARERITR